jgi:signal transduction histidine kinase
MKTAAHPVMAPSDSHASPALAVDHGAGAVPGPARDDRPVSILMVDDEPRNLAVLETVLDDPAYRLVRAGSADQALLALIAEEFALLIFDVRMPGMTGFELARLVKGRDQTSRVPIIFLTAYYNEDEHLLEGYGTGAVDYLHKPVNAAILRSKVAVFVELHRRSRECEAANRALLAEVAVRRAAEAQLRALSHRLVRVQEAERERVALELHNHITQQLCAITFRSEALVKQLATRGDSAANEAMELRHMVGQTAETVERVSRNLRSSILKELGLAAVLRDTTKDFTDRTGVPVRLACVELTTRLPPDVELTLYRILQEALKNVEKHAHACHVTVTLTMAPGGYVRLVIRDDGAGFDPEHRPSRQEADGDLGLLSVRERATYVGGTLTITSRPGAGTELDVRIPMGPAALATH